PRAARASRPAARCDVPLRSRPARCGAAPAPACRCRRQVRARAGGFLPPRARGVSRARAGESAPHPRDRRERRAGRGARAPGDRFRTGDRVKPYPWHEADLARLLADRQRLPHALLVHGSAGIGKTRFIRALAAAALCERPKGGLACGACESCHWLEQGNHPDFREIVPEAAEDDEEGAEAEGGRAEKAKSLVIKIDQVRALADFLSLSTHRAGYRVLLLHPAEALHPAAANALLKTLEEPPPATLIVLASDRPARLLATIRSRCRRVALHAPGPATALAWLRAQGVAEPEAALAMAGGAPLLAQRFAEPDEARFRRKLLAELAKPGGADALAFAATVDRGAVEPLVFWMQT